MGGGYQICRRFLAESIHGSYLAPVTLQLKNIRILVDKSVIYQLFQSHLRKPVHVQRVPAHHQGEGLDLFSRAVRVYTVQQRRSIIPPYLRRSSADRTLIRYDDISAAGKVIVDLRDDHVGLIYVYRIPYAKLELLHDAHVMHACPGDGGALQLHRIKYGHWIDETCP